MKISDETKVGVLAAFGLTILIIGYSFLKGNNVFTKKVFYYAKYTKVEGLTVSDPVTLNGLVIGKVKSLGLSPGKKKLVIAKLQMDHAVNVPVNSSFELYSSDLLGEKAVKLNLGDSEEIAMDGDTLAGDVASTLQEEVSMQILPVKQKAEDLLGSIDSVIQIVREILKGGEIETSLENIGNATGKFEDVARNLDSIIVGQKQNIDGILSNINHITGNLDSNSENISNLLANLSSLSDTLEAANIAQTVNNLNATLVTLHEVLDKINNSEGTIGMLVNDKEVYDNLAKAIANLESLLEDVEDNPSRYVHFSMFGGGSKKKKAAKEASDQQQQE